VTLAKDESMALPGVHDRCPVCGAALWASAREALGRRGCPRCGADLWVLGFSAGPVFLLRRPGESLADVLAALAGPRLGASAKEIEAAMRHADSLDLVELVLEVEEALRSRGT
jgi:hypothetical protein